MVVVVFTTSTWSPKGHSCRIGLLAELPRKILTHVPSTLFQMRILPSSEAVTVLQKSRCTLVTAPTWRKDSSGPGLHACRLQSCAMRSSPPDTTK